MRFNQDHGAMLITAAPTGITYQFYSADNLLIDDFTVAKNCASSTAAAGSQPTPTTTQN